ncbi:MAG: ribosome biogenesis GTPase [Saprospiraceae bacterium]|jgi:ribosome biogenesis GTPase
MTEAVVIRSTGKFYTIRDSKTNEIYNSNIRGKFRTQGLKLTNPIAVGDKVVYEMQADGVAMITEILPRTNYVVRQSPRKKHYLHLLASNIDQAIVVVTIVEPNLKQGFIDRFLLMTEPYDIPVHIVFNKKDLYGEKELSMYEFLSSIYTKIGYTTLLTSIETGDGMDALKALVNDKVTLIAGQSGVGKSSIINALIPTLDITTKYISDYSGKGQHTTTFAEMHDLPDTGQIIDTPGIKTLSYNHLEVMDVSHNFREFFVLSDSCKYNNCTHREEPKCAVKQAIEEGSVSELRYHNYLQIIEDIENQNYWERIKDY